MAPCYAADSEIDPCDDSRTFVPSTTTNVYYLLINYTAYDDWWHLTKSCDGVAVTNCSPTSSWVLVPAMSSVSHAVQITTSSTPGSGWISVEVETGPASGRLFTTTTVTVANPDPSPLTLDISYTNNSYQSTALCAAACFGATYAQSTVPFFSLDTPNAVTMVYNSEWVSPRPFVFADVIFGATTPAVSEYWLDVQVNGSPASFVNGNSGRIYFQGGSSSVRLGGQLIATGMATGVYPMTITVTAVRSGGNEVLTRQTELMVVNETGSPIAAGWTIAGLQRLYFPGVGGYMITEGGGTAVRFSGLGSYAADFTYLTFDGYDYTRHYPDGSRTLFQGSGNHAYTADRTGRRTDFGYSGSQLVTIVSPARYMGMPAPYLSLSYGASGLSSITEISQSGPNRVTTVWVWEQAGSRNLWRITDPDGYFTHFGYEPGSRLSTVTDRRNGTWLYHWDSASWRLAEYRLPEVPIDQGGGVTALAIPKITYESWQTKGVPPALTSSSSPGQPAALSSIYATIIDEVGFASTFSVNAFGQPTRVTDPAGRTTIISYDGTRPTSVTEPNGARDYFSWNGAFLAWTKSAGDAEQSFGYGVFGQLQQVWGPGTREELRYLNPANGNVDSVRYSASAQPAQMIRYFYDATTKVVNRVVDAFGHETSFERESVFANTRRVISPGNRIVDATFDAYGRTATVTPAGRPTQTIQYDAANRPTHAYDGVNSQPVAFGYDALFQTSVTDQKSQVYATQYNALGWPIAQTDPVNAVTTIRYDKRGLATSTTNRRGQRVDMTYDTLGRILSKTGANTTSDYFAYSADDRITVAWNSVARDSMFYDPFTGSDSTVTRLQSPYGEKRFRIYQSNHPDLATPDTMKVASNTGVIFPQRRYSWDDSTGALDSFAFVGYNALSMGYNAEQLRTGTTFPNSSGTRTESYTSLHSVIQSQFSAGTLNSNFYRAYQYDSLGRVKATINGPSNATRSMYTFDNLGRLLYWQRDGGCQVLSENPDYGANLSCTYSIDLQSYSYDQVGNRTDRSGVTGPANRIQSFDGITFFHDADGNIIQKYRNDTENRQYWWSAEARLDSAQQASWSKVKYDYDAVGRPVRKWRGDPVNGWLFDRLWIYDGDHRLLSLDSNMHRIEEYAYAPGIDQPIATIRGNTAVSAVGYHVQDKLGNILGLIENGAVVSQASSYDVWGTKTETGSAYNNQLFWKGLKWEGDVINLYYMRNRWYDPEMGRFMTEDPIGVAGGINLYIFAGNDPVNGWDPYGLDRCPDALEGNGYASTIGNNGKWWCVPVLPEVVIKATGGAGGGSSPGSAGPGSPWAREGRTGGAGGKGGTGDNGWDVGERAEYVCRSSILAATGSVVLDLAGFKPLVAGARGVVRATSNARFNRRFHYPIPSQIVAGSMRGARAAAGRFIRGYAYGLLPGDAFSLAAESLIGEGFNLWGYVPVPFVGSIAAVVAIPDAC